MEISRKMENHITHEDLLFNSKTTKIGGILNENLELSTIIMLPVSWSNTIPV